MGRRRISKQLLPLGSALEPERLTVMLGKLTDDTEREVIRLLYGEWGEATRAAKEAFEPSHQAV